MKQLTWVAIGLGSNLGDRLGILKKATEQLTEDLLFQPRSSSVYETAPWGSIQDQPTFLNAILVGQSEWKPSAIVSFLKNLEKQLGRANSERFGPREIDLDLIAYDEKNFEADGVKVPHPRMEKREFVLRPFSEVWPEWRHPQLHQTATQLLKGLASSSPLSATLVAAPLIGKETP